MNQIPQPQNSSDWSISLENSFGTFGALIRSLAFSIMGMISFMAYRFFEVNSIFFSYFPEHLTGVNRDIASYLIAVVFIVPTLLFMSNADKLKNLFTSHGKKKGVAPAVAMAVITFIINLFFWKVWIGSADTIIFKAVISIITAYLDYTFAELFNKKFQDWVRTSSIHQSFYALETRLNGIKTDINKALQTFNGYKQKLTETKETLTKIEREINAKKKALERFSCPYCLDYIGETQNGLNKHLGGCKARHHEKAH